MVISTREKALLARVSPSIGTTQYLFPEPKLPPLNRLRERLAHANQLYVYKRKCEATGKTILSMYSPLVKFPVYDNEYWWTDKWDARDWGRPFNFNKTFFEQYVALRDLVPHLARSAVNNENCDYCNNVNNNKNGYLIFNTSDSEDCFYGENVVKCKDCVECTQCKRCELCFECVLCVDCYNVQYSEGCDGCQDSRFLLNCRSCRNCICCANLYRKEYCIFNQQHSKADYERYVREISWTSLKDISELLTSFEKWSHQFPRPHLLGKQIENATGNVLYNVRDAENCFLVFGGENLVHCYNLDATVKDCLDFSAFGLNVELTYQSVRCGIDCYNLCFCISCIGSCARLLYCSGCRYCEDCFGCVNLLRRKYCIFNKQYTEQEYHQIVPRIIEHMKQTGEWGQFFPVQISAIPYNHSLAQRFFPMIEADARAQGYSWFERDELANQKAISADDLPDGLPEGNNPLVAKSAQSGRSFLITAKELEKYHRLQVPLPRLTYDERMTVRAEKLGGVTLRSSQCAKTGIPIQTAYPANSLFPIWAKSEFDKDHYS